VLAGERADMQEKREFIFERCRECELHRVETAGEMEECLLLGIDVLIHERQLTAI
jgi:hypothetical protein